MTRPDWVMVPTWWLEARGGMPDDGDYLLPAWQRAAFLSMARMRRDGHAHFAGGEIAQLLGADARNARRAVQEAVQRRWLDPSSLSSRMRCMVVPLGFSHGLGRFPAPCSLHSGEKSRNRGSDSDPHAGGNPRNRGSNLDPLGGQNLTPTVAESGGSQGVLSLILPSPHPLNRTSGFGPIADRRCVA
ncbi:MAG: hypothetical protein FWF90_05020 [Promicromonosporaceae bacterium]|nr:hypothetical protein [Promicromonosporaceae bacterium]